ncbi:MAG: hypothetical protein CMF42_03070 [Legionellales bacterium]|nr:hypothetical protein [Legionellales bacterium]OUX67752.1 MAG: hypothetical protein CBD38_01935 [bacterium TMED178]|tara:strand:- start:7181 stop:8320 length:1140 start_codon:yes stop_codon:yes gene_type:complete
MKKIGSMILSAAAIFPIASNAAQDLDIGGSARIGVEYSIIPTKWIQANRQDGLEVVSNNSTFFLAGEKEVGKGAKAYFKYEFGVLGDLGSIDTASTSSLDYGTNLSYVGYTYNNFDVRMGAIESIPYQYVGKYDDVAFANGYGSYSANHRIQKAVAATYQLRDLQIGGDIQATATSITNGAQGDQQESAIYSYAVGAQYKKGCVEVGAAYNAYVTGATGDADSNQSEQLQSTNNEGNIPSYWGIGFSYDVNSIPVYKNIETGDFKIFASYNNLARGNNGATHGTEDSLTNGTEAGFYNSGSYSIGLSMMDMTLRYDSGFLDSGSDAILLNYERHLADNVTVRAEANWPGVLAVDTFYVHGGDAKDFSANTYMVDLKYDF